MGRRPGRPTKTYPYPAGEAPAGTMTKAAFGRFIGAEPWAISDWIARGPLSLAETDDGRLDTEIALEALEGAGVLVRGVGPAEPPPPDQIGAPDGSLTEVEAQRLDANLRAHLRMLEVKERRAALVDRAGAERLCFEASRTLRDGFMGFPARDAALIAAELGTDPAKTLLVLERAVRRYLESVPLPRVDWDASAPR